MYGSGGMVTHMKTTIDLPDELVAQVKSLAQQEGTTMRELIMDGLRVEIERRANRPSARPDFVFPTFRGGGFAPDVDPTMLRELANER